MLAHQDILPLITTTSEAFSEAMKQGIGSSPMPSAMRSMLQNNVFIFSGFKTHAQLSAISALLLDDKGKKKPFDTFLQDVKAIDKTYNQTYLRAEYNFATQSARSAAQWADYQKDGDLFNLQYRTAGDERVRESHMLLNHTTLPLSDPFWKKYFPPNGWNCRCTAVQVRKSKYPLSDSASAIAFGEKATTAYNSKGRNALAIFRFNPGIEHKIFPPRHPYLPKPSQLGCDNCSKNMLAYNPKNSMCQACSTIKYCLNENQMANNSQWISDTIDRLLHGKKKYQTCKVGIVLGQAPEKLLQFSKKKNIPISDTTMAISDEKLLHSCRDFKRGLDKNIALSDKDLSLIPEKIKDSVIYYDPVKNNFLFISRQNERFTKLVFQHNFDMKMNGEKHTKMIQFVTAGFIDKIESSWEKIN